MSWLGDRIEIYILPTMCIQRASGNLHTKLSLVLWDDLEGGMGGFEDRSQRRGYMFTYSGFTLLSSRTNTTLQSNYIPPPQKKITPL